MADRTIVLATNKRHAVRGLTVVNPQEFSAYQEDNDDLTYIVDMSSYLDGATISSVTRTPTGVTVSNTSNTTTRLTQRLKGFGYVDFKVTTSSGDIEEFRITIQPRAGSAFFLPNIASVPQNTAQLYNAVADVNGANIDSGISWVRTAGYYTVGDGGGALYKRASSAPSHGAYVTSNATTTYWELAEVTPNVLQAGAKGDNSTNDAAAFQACINYLPNGGAVIVPALTYALSTALTANKGVLLSGDSRADVSSNTNGSTTSASPRIRWAGASGSTMFTISPASVGDVVWGGGAEGIEWDGAALAATAVHFDNCKYTVFDGKVRNTTTTAVKISSTSGSASNFSQHNIIRSLEYVWGVAAACENSNGLTIVGNGSTAPGTQHTCGVIFGLVYNGSLLSISETDNSRFDSVHAAVQSGGSGRAIDLLAGGAQDANHNFFQYVVGPVRQGSGLEGNTFLHYNSEGGGITQSSGSSVWDGKLHDYGTGNIYRSHAFALRDKICVPSGAIIGGASVTTGDFAAQWTGHILADAATRDCSVVLPTPYHLHNGVIEGVEVLVGSDGTSAGNYRVRLRCSTKTNATNLATPETDETQTVAAEAQYVAKTITFTFSSELAFTRNDHIWIRFTRIGADAADTNTDGMYVLGFRVLYRSSGPTTAGSGTYTIPNW